MKINLNEDDLVNTYKKLTYNTVPSRNLDGEIMFVLFAQEISENHYMKEDDPSWSFAIAFPQKNEKWIKNCRKGIGEETIIVWKNDIPILMNHLRVPKLTTSIDAALSLFNNIFPEKDFEIKKSANNSYEFVFNEIKFCSSTIPIAILNGIFSTLICKGL